MEPYFPTNLITGGTEALLISLPLENLLSLCSTNSQFNLVCQDEGLWRSRFINEFPLPNSFIKPNNMTWKQFYLYLATNNVSVEFYVNNHYVKNYYLPHITANEHFSDYLEKLKSIIVRTFNLSSEYLILYNTQEKEDQYPSTIISDYTHTNPDIFKIWEPIAYSIPLVSTYVSDWTIDETILPPPITQVYIYTNPNSTPPTDWVTQILEQLDMEPTLLNELHIRYLIYYTRVDVNRNITIEVNGHQVVIPSFRIRQWPITKLLTSLMSK
jgi:hypothetical protein